eukprot:scaffold57253_cov64-Phaeocystis_antarctica.AAC.4
MGSRARLCGIHVRREQHECGRWPHDHYSRVWARSRRVWPCHTPAVPHQAATYLRSPFAPRECPPAARATTPHARARPPRARPSHASPARAVTRLTSASPPRAARRHSLARRRGAWPLAHHQLQRTAVADALRCHRLLRVGRDTERVLHRARHGCGVVLWPHEDGRLLLAAAHLAHADRQLLPRVALARRGHEDDAALGHAGVGQCLCVVGQPAAVTPQPRRRRHRGVSRHQVRRARGRDKGVEQGEHAV